MVSHLLHERCFAPTMWLGSGAAPPQLVGGKAHGLGRLAEWHKPTPRALCLTAAAFDDYFASGGLIDSRRELEAKLPAEYERDALQALCWRRPLPDATRSAVAEALPQVLDGSATRRLAVRSSAIDEDGASASFAGQHETVLDVQAPRWEDAVRQCWSSLWSSRAVSYRVRKGLPLVGLAMAVVIQGMVEAEVSAVVFSRHPVTASAGVTVVAARGAGERLVSGRCVPHTVVMDRSTLAVEEETLGEDGRVLDDAELRYLADEALAIEARCGGGVDIEASRERGRWRFLQVRPITV